MLHFLWRMTLESAGGLKHLGRHQWSVGRSDDVKAVMQTTAAWVDADTNTAYRKVPT